jgi:hypothetical protein
MWKEDTVVLLDVIFQNGKRRDGLRIEKKKQTNQV